MLQNIEKRIVSISFLIVALAIAYYFVIYLPQKDATARQAQQEYRKQQQADLNNCLSAAETDYNANWVSACKTSGLNNTGPDCSLPSSVADGIDQYRTSEKNDCFKQYPQN